MTRSASVEIVSDPRIGNIEGLPAGESSAPAEIDVLEIHEVIGIEEGLFGRDLEEHGSAIPGGARRGTKHLGIALESLRRFAPATIANLAAETDFHARGVDSRGVLDLT